ncbi:MAG: LLM class flavin-dependent oxidoreductase [Candidatus Bathyarchaeia archaeon]
MIKFGVYLPFYSFGFNCSRYRSFEILKEVVLRCEQLGYHSVWLDDHVMYGDKPILECWTILSALSTLTRKIRLGTLVLCNQFRSPALLAKMAATLDVISDGRLEFGIGAGIQREEHEAYGFPFPNLRTRAEQLSEALEIIKRMWTMEESTFNGLHFRINRAKCVPKPIQKPHPPVIIGGVSKSILEVTAKYADRFDWGPLSVDQYERKLSLLETYCRKVGRNLECIEKSCWVRGAIYLASDKQELKQKICAWKPENVPLDVFNKMNFVGTPDDLINEMQPYLDMGVTFFMLYFGDLPAGESLKIFAETVLRELS